MKSAIMRVAGVAAVAGAACLPSFTAPAWAAGPEPTGPAQAAGQAAGQTAGQDAAPAPMTPHTEAPSAGQTLMGGIRFGRIDFAYTGAELSAAGDRITWRWALGNSGDAEATGIVLVHRLGPGMAVRTVSDGCTAEGAVVTCRYGSIAAGAVRSGSIEAGFTREIGDTVEIEGRVIWGQDDRPGSAPTAPVTQTRRLR